MIQVKIDTTIQRPVEEVFEQLIDIPRYPEWMREGGLFVSCSKDSGGPVGAGTRYSVISGLKFPTFSGSKLPIQTQKNIIHPLRIMLKKRISLPRDRGKKENKCGLT